MIVAQHHVVLVLMGGYDRTLSDEDEERIVHRGYTIHHWPGKKDLGSLVVQSTTSISSLKYSYDSQKLKDSEVHGRVNSGKRNS